MITESQIRQWLARYLSGEIPLEVFEDWLAQQSWNMHKDSDQRAQELASAIELRLAEHSSGHLDHRALREELLPFVTNYTVQVSIGGAPLSLFGSSNVTAQKVVQVVFPVQETPEVFAGTSLAGVSG
jgi:hypothetical protein